MSIKTLAILLVAIVAAGAASSATTRLSSTCIDVVAKSGASYVPKDTILPKAAMNNDVENVCQLLNAGVDVNEVQHTREDNTAALHEAAGANLLEMAKLLLEHGADVNVKTTAKYESFYHSLYTWQMFVAECLTFEAASAPPVISPHRCIGLLWTITLRWSSCCCSMALTSTSSIITNST